MSNIKIMALGGLGENGKNLTVVEVNKKIFILDAGMRYPDIDMYGVDLVIPNIDYLVNNKQNIQGIFISHGHDENVGAIPYLLKQLQTKVFATHFTIVPSVDKTSSSNNPSAIRILSLGFISFFNSPSSILL